MEIHGKIPENGFECRCDYSETARIIEKTCFTGDLGIELTDLAPGKCVLRLNVLPRHLNTNNIVHGGVLYALADTAASLAAASFGEGGSTVQGNVSYPRPASGRVLECHAHVTKYGSHLIWSEADVMDESGEVCCHGEFINFQMEGSSNFGIRKVGTQHAE